MNYKIVGTTVTELCQTESSGTVNGVPTVSIKKKECIEDGIIGSYPYYSGNSFRGIMHREIASYIVKRIVSKDVASYIVNNCDKIAEDEFMYGLIASYVAKMGIEAEKEKVCDYAAQHSEEVALFIVENNYEILSHITKHIGVTLSPSDYHLNFAGGGSNYQDQTLDVVEKIREMNPLVSVFGASLAIEGKLMVSNLEPTNKFWRDSKDKDYRYSALRGSVTYTKVDDLIKAGVNDKYNVVVSNADKEEYLEINSDVQAARELAREKVKKGDDAEKVSKANIQAFNKLECIIVGANLECFIGEKIKFTKIEKGLLLKGIELMMKQQLGGMKNKGFGVMTYSVQVEDEISTREVINSSKNENNIFNPIVSLQYSDEEQECINAFHTWLNEATMENLEISKVLLG